MIITQALGGWIVTFGAEKKSILPSPLLAVPNFQTHPLRASVPAIHVTDGGDVNIAGRSWKSWTNGYRSSEIVTRWRRSMKVLFLQCHTSASTTNSFSTRKMPATHWVLRSSHQSTMYFFRCVVLYVSFSKQHCSVIPSYLHSATFEMWCWSGLEEGEY